MDQSITFNNKLAYYIDDVHSNMSDVYILLLEIGICTRKSPLSIFSQRYEKE